MSCAGDRGGPGQRSVAEVRASAAGHVPNRAFADLLGIAQPTLSAYESGHRQPTVPTLLRLLKRAGLELRMELAERDDHDQVLAEWEQTLSPAELDRLRAGGYRRTSDAG